MAITAGALFEIGDWPTGPELRSLGVEPGNYRFRVELRVEATGEKRAPRAGEWFLSGAIVQGYRAENDLLAEYNIARLVRVRQVTTVEVTHRIEDRRQVSNA